MSCHVREPFYQWDRVGRANWSTAGNRAQARGFKAAAYSFTRLAGMMGGASESTAARPSSVQR
jgi:hypothetical protein